MRKELKKYLAFTSSERRVALVAVSCILAMSLWPYLAEYVVRQPPSDQHVWLLQQLISKADTSLLVQEMPDDENYPKSSVYPERYMHTKQQSFQKDNVRIPATMFPFDPDTLTIAQWTAWGVPVYVAERIIKYKNKGGSFDTPEDVKKIYGFPEDIFYQLQPFMRTAEQQTELLPADVHTAFPDYTGELVDLNAATAEQLKPLGLSAGDVTRILRFREQAGGFYAVDQLYGVYGLDASAVQHAEKWLRVERNSVIKINLNTTDSVTLAKHIYISDILAGAIVRYREQTGKFYSLSEVLKVQGMYPALFEKLKPYLQI